MISRPPAFTLFPYTTLFRSKEYEQPASPLAKRRLCTRTIAIALEIDRNRARSEEHTSELQSRPHLVCRLLLEKKKHHNPRKNAAHQIHLTFDLECVVAIVNL